MHHFLEKIANGVGGKKGRFITLSIWILAVILLQLFLPSANEYKDDAASDLKASEPSVIADKKSQRIFWFKVRYAVTHHMVQSNRTNERTTRRDSKLECLINEKSCCEPNVDRSN